jgi:hypothetical protein
MCGTFRYRHQPKTMWCMSWVELRRPEEVRDALRGLLCEGAQGLIAQAVQELEEFLAGFAGQHDEAGREVRIPDHGDRDFRTNVTDDSV